MVAPKGQIDWEAVWNSLNWDDEGRQQAAEQERLRQRARQYAAPVAETDVLPEVARPYLLFELGEERYGIDVMLVRGVRGGVQPMRVPGTPDFYPGVINARGQIITALDLRRFLGITMRENDPLPDEAIITQAGRLQLALLVHHVRGVSALPVQSIVQVEGLSYVQGVTPEQLIILNINQMFEDERLVLGAIP